MKTSYKNCNPEIAVSLQRGDHIECQTFNFNKVILESSVTIIAYEEGSKFPYHSYDDHYAIAEPIPKTETRVIGCVAMVEELLDRGFEPDNNGYFSKRDNSERWTPGLLSQCGKKPNHSYAVNWHSWMLEEVEV